MLTCKYCGGEVLLKNDAMTGVCQICGRTYSGEVLRRMCAEPVSLNKRTGAVMEEARQQRIIEQRNGKKDGLPPWAIVLIVMIVMSGVFGSASFFPIIPFVLIAFAGTDRKKKQQPEARNQPMERMQKWFTDQSAQNQPVRQAEPVRNSLAPEVQERVRRISQPAVGERLDTPYDYLDAFRILPLTSMPFRDEAAEAMEQLNTLITKQQGIATLLPAGHPYYPTVNDAVQYFLRNTKQILFRLRYCDQNDMSRREEHKAFFRRTLDENAAILRDLETFMIELSQMEDGTPMNAPALNMLSQSMQNQRNTAPDDEELMHMLYGYQTEFPAAKVMQNPTEQNNSQNQFNQLMQ